jgi:hypothetical protein
MSFEIIGTICCPNCQRMINKSTLDEMYDDDFDLNAHDSWFDISCPACNIHIMLKHEICLKILEVHKVCCICQCHTNDYTNGGFKNDQWFCSKHYKMDSEEIENRKKRT